MKEVQVEKLPTEYYEKYNLPITPGTLSVYAVPEPAESIESLKSTFDKQYDPIEGKMVEGGLPVLWERTDG